MARPIPKDIVSGQEGWDADVNDNKAITFDAPFPIFIYDGNLTALEAAYPAANYTQCICMAKPSGSWLLVYSDGSSWAAV